MVQFYFSIGYSWVTFLGTGSIGAIKCLGWWQNIWHTVFPISDPLLFFYFYFLFFFLLCHAWVNRRTPHISNDWNLPEEWCEEEGPRWSQPAHLLYSGKALLLTPVVTPSSCLVTQELIHQPTNQPTNEPFKHPATIWLDPINSNFNNYHIHLGKGMWKRWVSRGCQFPNVHMASTSKAVPHCTAGF